MLYYYLEYNFIHTIFIRKGNITKAYSAVKKHQHNQQLKRLSNTKEDQIKQGSSDSESEQKV